MSLHILFASIVFLNLLFDHWYG